MIKTDLFISMISAFLAYSNLSYAKYDFTSNWFHQALKENWRKEFSHLKTRPINYLEVGVWEGRSFFWVLENIAAHKKSTMTAVDIFYDQVVEKRFRKNIKSSGEDKKISVIKGSSQKKLKFLKEEFYDLIYIDGSHRGRDVLTDGILSWDLLKDGGTLVFDDYTTEFDERYPLQLETWPAIDSFIQYFDNEIVNVVRKNEQIFLTKKKSCFACIRICGGEYSFNQRVFTKGNNKIKLNGEENKNLALFLSRKPKDISTVEFMKEITAPSTWKFVSRDIIMVTNKLCGTTHGH